MPEAGGEDRSTDRTGADPATDSGYSEWISEVRRLYVEPKGPAELYVVAEDDEAAPAPAKGRGRRLGRGRRSQQASAAPEAAAESPTPARPSLADLMAARAEEPVTSAPRAEAATADGTADDLARTWPASAAEEPEPAFEPWPVAVRDETVEDEPEARPVAARSPAPTVDEGWPEAPPPASPPVDEGRAGTPHRVGSEQAWIAALADAAETAPAVGDTPAPGGTLAPDVTLAADGTPAPEGTRSWWDEAALDDVETGTDPVQPVERAQPAAPPPVTEAPARRSSWFDEEPGADPTDGGGSPLPDPLADTVSADGTDLGTGAVWVDPTDEEPGTPTAPAPGAPRTRAEVRAATRQAERARRARRRRALVAAVVLLVVVAAVWFVLRPHGSAAAGASTAQHPRVAVAMQHAAPLAL